jgi:hypothetical protein
MVNSVPSAVTVNGESKMPTITLPSASCAEIVAVSVLPFDVAPS